MIVFDDYLILWSTPREAKHVNVRFGSWLRDNALTQAATVHYPVNVVRHG
jgi:hypothetical protein